MEGGYAVSETVKHSEGVAVLISSSDWLRLTVAENGFVLGLSKAGCDTRGSAVQKK